MRCMLHITAHHSRPHIAEGSCLGCIFAVCLITTAWPDACGAHHHLATTCTLLDYVLFTPIPLYQIYVGRA